MRSGEKERLVKRKNGTRGEQCETAVTVESGEDIPHWANHAKKCGRGHAPI